MFGIKSILKKSASISEDLCCNFADLKLRSTKSSSGIENFVLNDFGSGEMYELVKKHCGDETNNATTEKYITTRDIFTNEIFRINTNTLTYKGKSYSEKEVARSWKKDYKMWLWKSKKNYD